MTVDSNDMEDTSQVSAEQIIERDRFERVVANNERVFVDFYADWCGPCQLMHPTVDELATEVDATVVKVDVETLPGVTNQYDVESIPTFLVLEDGEVKERLIGLQDKEALVDAVTQPT